MNSVTVTVPVVGYGEPVADRERIEAQALQNAGDEDFEMSLVPETWAEEDIYPGQRLKVICPDNDGETLICTLSGQELYVDSRYLVPIREEAA